MVLSQESTPDVVNHGCYDFRLSELIRQRAWVEIDQNALRHNVRQFKGLLKHNTDLMAVVKADAYGHGAVRVAQMALEAGATWLAIALFQPMTGRITWEPFPGKYFVVLNTVYPELLSNIMIYNN